VPTFCFEEEGKVEAEALVRPVVESAGLELVEVVFGREGGRRVLRVTVDKEGGVDLDTIAVTSQKLSRRLDLEGFSSSSPYALEVSSPGVERPLRTPRDFKKKIGEKVKVKVAGVEPSTETGLLEKADDETIVVATDGGRVRIAYADIASARTVFEWGGKKK
jgi:ribosome maturation factor RimP